MSVITKIAAQAGRSDEFSVYIDDSYGFSLSGADLAFTGLTIGQSLSAKQLEALNGQLKWIIARSAALNYLSYRPRSSQELRLHLQRKGYGQEQIDGVIEQLTEEGLVDDLGFGQAWVRDRLRLKNVSRLRLLQELRAKGLDSQLAHEALAGVGEAHELETVCRLVQKKRSRYDDAGLFRYLRQQGFPPELIKEALRAEDE